jgi:hypothetical protein
MRSLLEGHTISREEIDFTFKRSINRKAPYIWKIYAVYLFLCKTPSQLMHFCHCYRSLKRVACDRTAFQQFIMMDSFLDCFIGCEVLALHLIVVWTWTDGSQMELSLDFGWMEEKLPANILNPFMHRWAVTGHMLSCSRMICPPFPQDICHAMHSETSEASENDEKHW